MKNFYFLSLSIIVVIFFSITSCDPLYEPINISGNVVSTTDNEPISEALVRITSPVELAKETFSNEAGEFFFEEVEVDSVIDMTFEAEKEGFPTETITVIAAPEKDLIVPDIKLSGEEQENSEDEEEESKGSANITLKSKTSSSIQVKSTGGTETVTFEFIVSDSTGTPVNSQNSAVVNFEITAGPDGGESLFPLSAETESGIAKTTLTSGIKSGVVQIRASFERNGIIEKSEPVPITISGGLPNENHFEVRSEALNIPINSISTNEISVLIGDKYGNTVIPGTAVFFSNNTSPGTANVTVETVGDDNTEITREIDIIYSGETELEVSPENINLVDFESQNFTVKLSDLNGNPLAAGTTFGVSIDNEDLELNGSTSAELNDTQKKGRGYTEFQFQLNNPDRLIINEDVTLTIQSDGPNGTVKKELVFDAEEVEPGQPGSIYLESISETNIGVRATGQKEDAQLIYQVVDENGIPLSNVNPVDVEFKFGSRPNGDEFLSSETVSTNNLGQASVTLTSGTKAGTVQVIAAVNVDNKTIESQPVSITISGGLPSDNHFEVRSEAKNIATSSTSETEISALVGDKYGNTVAPGTSVYFSTNKGIIDGSVVTDENGFARAVLRSNNTAPGLAAIQVETVGDNNRKVSETVEIVFSGEPELEISPDNIDLLGFASENFIIELGDMNGNPLAAGTNLNISVDNEDLVLNGDTNIELTDTQKRGDGYTEFQFQLRNPDRITITEDVTLSIESNGPNGSINKNLVFEVDEDTPGKPGSIYLESITDTDIGVRSTGQKEDTQLTFQVIDVNGNPLSNENPVDVEFKFGDKPNGDEFLSPEKVRTNNLGQATVSLTSGTEAGTVQIVAVVDTDSREIESQPVPVTINAGLPSQKYFSLVPPQINFPAPRFGEQYEFLVLAGDRYSNTVPDDIAIFFETNGGFIDGSGLTSNGRATTELTMGNPIPDNGRVTVRAFTSDDSKTEIEDRTDVLFSRQPIITTDVNSINLTNGDDLTINYSVQDVNELPMVEGTTISVAVEGEEIELIGQTDVTLRDVNPDFSNIDDLTKFKFNLKDADEDNNEDSPVIITIEVDGPNGYAKKVIEGRKAKGL